MPARRIPLHQPAFVQLPVLAVHLRVLASTRCLNQSLLCAIQRVQVRLDLHWQHYDTVDHAQTAIRDAAGATGVPSWHQQSPVSSGPWTATPLREMSDRSEPEHTVYLLDHPFSIQAPL